MPDWTKSMKQTYEYYTVDPGTWKDVKLISTVRSCNISRDRGVDTLGSATIDVDELIGESYIRVYLVTEQDEIVEKHPLATVLVQTPSIKSNGKVRTYSLDAYTPLLELTEKQPPIGYSLSKKTNIMDTSFKLTRENCRAPVVRSDSSDELKSDFIANTDDTWLTYNRDLLSNAKKEFDLDEMGRILFASVQDTESLQPVWTYTDDNSSILYSDFTVNRDLYGIPNVVEVSYTTENDTYYARVVNDDPNSPTSTVNRGREIVRRITNPGFPGEPSDKQIRLYAEQALRDLSTLEYTVTYKHGYCPVRIGDCVRFNCKVVDLMDVKAKVISQNIECIPGCPVTETAVYTVKLWGGE